MRTIPFAKVRPKFLDGRPDSGRYDADKQVHAAWLLWRTADVLPKHDQRSVKEAYQRLGYDLTTFAE